MGDSSVELTSDDFVTTGSTARGSASQLARPAALQYTRIWAAYNEQLIENWAAACDDVVKPPANKAMGQRTHALKTKLTRYLSLFPDDLEPPQNAGSLPATFLNDLAGIDGLPRSVINDRAEKCKKVVEDLTDNGTRYSSATTNAILWLYREEQFIAVGLRYLLPLSVNESQSNAAQRVETILLDIAVRYNSVAYHHVGHATTVLHHSVELAKHCDVWSYMNNKERMTFIYAAAGHDIGHPGRSSALLLKADHPLAILYNEKHVLENYHAANLIMLLKNNQWDAIERTFGPTVTGASNNDIRALIIQCILWTDIMDHSRVMVAAAETLEQVKKSGKVGTALGEMLSKNKAMLRDVLSMILKAADLSYLALDDTGLMIDWAIRYYVELYSQRYLEEEFKLPLCEQYGPMGLGSGRWFESNFKFTQDIVLPIARYLSSVEKRISPPSTSAQGTSSDEEYKSARLTSPDTAVQLMREARSRCSDLTEVANNIYQRDKRLGEIFEVPLNPVDSPNSSTLKPAMKWISRQTNMLKSKGSSMLPSAPRTKVHYAYVVPCERNADILKKARYLANS